jgi:hypothetical protein
MKGKIFNAQEEQIKESLGRGFDKGYFHALNGIRSVILATGKTETIISVQFIDAMIAETKNNWRPTK